MRSAFSASLATTIATMTEHNDATKTTDNENFRFDDDLDDIIAQTCLTARLLLKM
jgi:hypothetical protein